MDNNPPTDPGISHDNLNTSKPTVSTQSVNSPIAAPSAPLRPDMSSIYPGPSRSINAAPIDNSAVMDNTPVESTKNEVIIIFVVIFGAVIALISATNALNWIRIFKTPVAYSGSDVLGIILSLGEFILGIGLIARKEFARVLYMVIAIILLFFSLYGTFNYIKYVRLANKTEQLDILSTQQQIQTYNNAKGISNSEKTQVINELKGNEVVEKQTIANNKKLILPMVEGYVLAIVPILFLTRKSVEDVFN